MDSRDDAANLEQLRRSPKERINVRIKTKPIVSKKTADIQKEAGAAAEIENAERGCAIKPKVLRALGVDPDPVVGILEAIDARRTRAVGDASNDRCFPANSPVLGRKTVSAAFGRVSRS